MKYYTYTEEVNEAYVVAVLIKDTAFKEVNLKEYYLNPLNELGVPKEKVIFIGLKYNPNGKISATEQKEYLDLIKPYLEELQVKLLLVTDGKYFKTLTKKPKVEPYYGYKVECAYKGYEEYTAVLSINSEALFYKPDLQVKLTKSLHIVNSILCETYVDPGIREFGIQALFDRESIEKKLLNYLTEPILTCDIETSGLSLTNSIISISFAKNENEAIAFPIAEENKATLRTWFTLYKGTLIFHNCTFDIKMLIYHLFMNDPLDMEGLIDGLEVMFRSIEDTKLIIYLATNNTAGNNLKLKDNSADFLGNYGLINSDTDVTNIPMDQLLEYNAKDCLATWYVYNKFKPMMIADEQENLYKEIFIPSAKVICHMELIGMPMDMDQVQHAKSYLEDIIAKQYQIFNKSRIIKKFTWELNRLEMIKANAKLKSKVKSIMDFDVEYNPNSGNHNQNLIYDFMGNEVIDTTDSGLPATGKETLEKVLNKLIHEHGITEDELK
jgi:DNA polymerase I